MASRAPAKARASERQPWGRSKRSPDSKTSWQPWDRQSPANCSSWPSCSCRRAWAFSGGRLWKRAPRWKSALCKMLIIHRHPLCVGAPAPLVQGEDHALQLAGAGRGLVAAGQVAPEPGHRQVRPDAQDGVLGTGHT